MSERRDLPPPARIDLSERVKRGDLDAATLALAEQVIREDPSDLSALVIASRCSEAGGDLHAAAAQLETVLARDPRHVVACNRRERLRKQIHERNRAEMLLAAGRDRLIIEAERAKSEERDIDFQIEARRLLARTDATPAAWCALGAALRRRRDYGGALRAYGEARQMADSAQENPMAYTGLAAVMRDLRRRSESEALAQQVLEHHPRSPWALKVLAGLGMDIVEAGGDRTRLDEVQKIIDQLPVSERHELHARLASLQRAKRH